MKSWKSLSTRRYLFASAFVFVCVAALSSMNMARVAANFSHYSNNSFLHSAAATLGLFQGGIGSRTIISTIVGGGFSANAPVKSAPMVQPTAVAIDPQGRGFYVVDESNSASYLRFVNTTANPVTLGGVTIQPHSINLIAGGGIAAESAAAREVDLTLVTGIAVDPTGNAVYLTTPFVGALRAINVGTQNLTILNKTIAPGAIQTIYSINLPDFRSIVVNSARDFYYIGTGPNGSSRVVYKLESAANNNNGLVSVFAGGGTPQNGNGDDGQATLAKLTNPMALALDASGLLYVAEGGDTRTNPGAVRKIESNGLIDSVIKSLEFPTGIAIGQGNNLYVALGNAQQVIRVSPVGSRTLVAGSNQFAACDLLTNPNCGDGGAATAASLNLPGSTVFRNLTLAADANGFFLPDFTFKRVRYVNLAGGTVTVAGTAIGPGQINTVVGSGQNAPYDKVPATITELQSPVGVAVDANGNLFVSDSGASPLNLLRFINRGNSPVTYFAGTDWEMTAQPGEIITLNNRAGDPTSDDRIATAVFQAPQGLAVTANGVYIVDSQYGALVRPPNSLNGRRSGHIRFLNTTSSDVTIFPSGGVARVVVPAGQIKDIVGRNDPPPAGTIGEDGPASAGVIFPTDVAVDAAGNIYIADQGNNRIRRVNGSTGIITSVQSRQSDNTLAPLVTNAAAGVSFGPDGRLYIADTRNDRVLRQDAVNGTTFTVVANATKGINKPRDLTINSAGQVFVTNSGNHQILRIVAPTNALGSVSVVAGTGSQGFSGDGGPGNQAKLNFLNPTNTVNDIQVTTNIVTLSNGDMVFTDTNNDRIRLLTQIPNQTPVLAAVSDRTVDEGTTTTINFTATDGNNDPLTLGVSNKPAFANLTDNGNGTASLLLTPGFSDAGSYAITVIANDGDATDSKSFTVTVKDVNRAPAVEAAVIGSPLEATSAAGRQVNLSGTATDPDGDTVSYKWFDGATQIANTANATVTLGLGNHSIFLTATDSKNAGASSPAQAVVVQDTTPPVISGVPAAVTAPATSAAGAVVNYTLPTATDVVSGSVPVTADKASGSVFAVGTTNVKFTAADGRGNTATASFNVTVTPFSGGGGGGSYTISTYAGTGAYGFSGDNGPAGNASFKQLTALSHDRENNLLVVDAQSRNVRRIEVGGPGNVIRAVAGNSGNGNGGDAGLAIYATFGSPGGAAGDAAGTVYISDVTNHRIRKVGTDGKIFHFAGSTTGQSGGIGDNGQASTARFNRPSALVVDAQGNLYIADTGNNRIRVVSAATGIVTTVAGNGGAGYSGDGGPATSGSLNNPSGLAFDAQGNLYIADRSNHRVRKVNLTTQVITTAAGDGNPGFGGDNGSATTAQLNNPNDVAFDSSGNLLVADQSNNRIRRVNSAGQIATVAGDGTGGFGGDGGAATLAQLNLPSSVSILADGTVFVGDNGNIRIRKLAPVGGPGNRNPVVASTISNQTLTKGQSIDLPLAATDADNDSVTFTLVNAPSFATIVNANPAARTATLRLAPTQAGTFNNIQVKADDGKGGTATSPAFNVTVNDPPPGNQPPPASAGALPAMIEAASPAGAQVNLSGSGSDPDGDQITFSWTDNGNVIATSANATATLALGNHSIILTVTDSKGAKTSTTAQAVLVKDTTPPVISGVPSAVTVPATSTAGAVVNYTLPTATDVVSGSVPVTADKASGSVFAVGTTNVKFTATDGRGNTATASFNVTVTPFSTGGGGGYTISTYAGTGAYGFSGDNGPAGNASFKQLTALSHDKENNLLVVDAQSRNVRRIEVGGPGNVIRAVAGNSGNGNGGDAGLAIYATFGSPGGAAGDAAGTVYISDVTNHRIRKVGTDGKIFHFAGSTTGQSGGIGDNGQASTARFNRPSALVVDAQGNLYIADTGNNRIRVVSAATGIVTTVAGNGGAGYSGDGGPATSGSLNNPSGLAFDAQGNLYIADRSNHRVRKVNLTTQVITTAAGDGNPGFGGDNGSATTAQLNNPNDVAFDSSGNLLVADQSNNRIRRVNSAGQIATVAGDGTGGFGGDGGAATLAQLNLPSSVSILADGTVFVGDNGNIRIRKLAPSSPPPPANRAPVITSTIGNQTLAKGQSVDLPLAATDADNDSVTFTLVNAPSFAMIVNANPGSRTAMLRLAPAVAGTFSNIQVKADDGKGGTATSPAFVVVVNEPQNNPCLANVAAERWKGEYFNNRNLTGSPTLIRDDGDGSLNFEFGTGSPNAGCGVGVDNFSTRWTRDVPLLAGLYRFTTFTDDGVRLFINGQNRIDKWIDQGETRNDADISLSAGKHAVRMEYYENGGGATARLFWNSLNYFPIIPNIANQTVTRGQVLEVDIIVTEPDNDPVILSLSNAPSFVTLIKADPTNRRATLRIAPQGSEPEQQVSLTVLAGDGRGGGGVSNTFTITVKAATTQNRAPVALAKALPASVTAPDNSGATVQLDGSGSSDPDGDTLSYLWTDNGTVIATTAVANVKLAIGAHSITLTVNDGKGGTNSTNSQSVTVNAPAPTGVVINSISPATGRRGTTINVVITGSGFVQGSFASFSGGGVSTTTTFINENQLNVRVSILSTSLATARNLTITNPNGATATKTSAFMVTQ